MEILTPLSAGGMGEVLLARRRGAHGFEKLFAVKMILAELAARADVRAMFLDEARLLSRVAHPAVAQVVEFGESAGSLYLVMEYVAGVPFAELISASSGELSAATAARLIAEVCRGLHAVHELRDERGRSLGAVHRDVSPDNLILTYSGRVKLIDFGIALTRVREAPVTELGHFRGKPAYLAPEQLREGRVDRRADVYAASAVLLELMTRRLRFAGVPVLETLAAVMHAEPSVPPEVPGGLAEILQRGLAREPEQRFGDARALADALDAFAGGAGRESIEEFAERRLQKEREAHAAMLRGLLASYAPAPPPSGLKPVSVRITEADGEAPPPAPELEPPPVESRRSRREVMLALGSVVAVIVALAIAFSISSRSERLPPIVLQATPVPVPVRASTATRAVELAPAREAPAHAVVPAREPHRALPAPRPRREPNVVPPVGEKSFLTIGAKPFAVVWIDGREIGTTPIVDLELPAGPHHVRCIEPDTGNVRSDEQLTLAPGQHRRLSIP